MTSRVNIGAGAKTNKKAKKTKAKGMKAGGMMKAKGMKNGGMIKSMDYC